VTSFDGYDGEELDDGAPRHVRRDIEADLRDLMDLVAAAKQMPLSNSALVSRDEVMGLLEQAISSLPEEIREARWALRDREELMAAEVQKAQQLMDQVRAEAARMVDKTEIVRQSRLKAEQIVADAHAQARQMINQSEDFIDGKLGGFEIVLDRLLKTAHSGRERLSAQGLPTSMINEASLSEDFLSPAPPPAAAPLHEYVEPDAPESSFFDQDSF
jgi:cell division septum initiation protein DivIVA